MSVSYPKLINFHKDFLLRNQAKWVIFWEVFYYFHESTSSAIFTKHDLSRTEKRKEFPYFLDVLKFIKDLSLL